MNANGLLILNFQEVRRRSIKVWKSIPADKLDWRPDEQAMSCAEMIRHVLEGEYLYHQILLNGGTAGLDALDNPFESQPFKSVEAELDFAQPYRDRFIQYIDGLNPQDLEQIRIDRSDKGYIRSLGDMLLRIAYHESVHTGQLLDYMRTMGIERPVIWD